MRTEREATAMQDVIEFRMCGGKRIFTERRMARSVKRTVRQQEGLHVGVYRCPRCGHYHLGKDHEVKPSATEVMRLELADLPEAA